MNQEEVITIAASGQVATFKDYAYAKMILLKQYHGRIYQDAKDLATKHSIEQLRHIATATLKLDLHNFNTRMMLEIKDKFSLAQAIWPMLLTLGRVNKNKALNKHSRNPHLPTHVTYFCDYTPNEDPVLDLNYIKLPPQARVLVDMLVDRVRPTGNSGLPEFLLIKYLNELQEQDILKTKQSPLSIWKYYFNVLVAKGFVDKKSPKI